MKVGDFVKAKVSAMKDKIGRVVSINNTTLPIAVVFIDSETTEWDFKEEELEVQKNE